MYALELRSTRASLCGLRHAWPCISKPCTISYETHNRSATSYSLSAQVLAMAAIALAERSEGEASQCAGPAAPRTACSASQQCLTMQLEEHEGDHFKAATEARSPLHLGIAECTEGQRQQIRAERGVRTTCIRQWSSCSTAPLDYRHSAGHRPCKPRESDRAYPTQCCARCEHDESTPAQTWYSRPVRHVCRTVHEDLPSPDAVQLIRRLRAER